MLNQLFLCSVNGPTQPGWQHICLQHRLLNILSLLFRSTTLDRKITLSKFYQSLTMHPFTQEVRWDVRWINVFLMSFHQVKAVFSSSHVWMLKLDYKESWAPKNWSCWTVVLEKTLGSPLEIQPVHPKGNQSWICIGRTDAEAETPILWPPDAKNWLIWQVPDAGKDWRQEKETTEDEVIRWHHRLNRHEFE